MTRTSAPPPDGGADRAPAMAVPPAAYAAALAHLPGMGPVRLVALLRTDGPEATWAQVLAGTIRRPDREGRAAGALRTAWADAARRRDVAGDWGRMQAAGINVAYLGDPGLPAVLAEDPEPPGVIFWRGDLGVVQRPRVAVIGTRHCTSYGRSVAAELGHDLAANGVCVVSGLALGIDGAAHHGALGAVGGVGPLGVAASGVDCPYPLRHTELWERVVAAGAVMSETAPGQPAQAWRFPARNRLIAGVAQAVVVVESHSAGGSMLTVAAAAERGVEVLAVPGPVTSASSLGTNQLLHEGVSPARHAGDVLAALGDLRPWSGAPLARRPPDRTGRAPARDGNDQGSMWECGPDRQRPGPGRPASTARLDAGAQRVLDAVDRTPTATSVIVERTGLALGSLSLVLLRLETLDLVRGQGVWWERCDRQ